MPTGFPATRWVSDGTGSPTPPTSPDSGSQPTEADAEGRYADKGKEGKEGEEVFGLALAAPVEPSAAGQPGRSPLNHPSVAADPL
ncbi:hypothetical protein GCM10018791_60020 [Streptomyces zaomyceticus]|nr:hypothetical protein GCM10018791_60020 [Streptomyces zaomyceticus]